MRSFVSRFAIGAFATVAYSVALLPFFHTYADEPDPRRPSAIETKEVPKVSAELMRKLARYQNTRSALFRGWAPDGNGILISTRFANSLQLHRVYLPGGRREQITFSDEPVSGQFVPQSKTGAMLLLIDQGGNENDQLYWFEPSEYRMRLLTDGKSRHWLGPISPAGTKIIYGSNQRNGRDVDLYLNEPQTGSVRMLMQVDRQTWYPTDLSPDGKTVAMYRYVSANVAYPAVLDIASGKRTDLPLPTEETAAFGMLQFAADGKSLYLVTDAGNEFRRLARFDLATQKYSWLSDDLSWDVSDLDIDPVNGNVAFAINDDGMSRVFLLPKGNEKQRRELKLPTGIVGGLEFSPDGKQIGFTLSRPNAPADAYSYEIASEKLARWTFSEVGGLNPENFVEPSRIRFRSFDDRMIPAYYFRPRTASPQKKSPVYISIHGGPENQYQPYFSAMTQYYVNELGIAVIHPNVRGSSGYGKTYLKLDNAELREDSVKDIGGLLDWIAQQPELDASRVSVAGGSYGGYMVLASLTHFGDRIKAGIDYVGIANFISFLEKTAAYRADLRRAEYGDERDPAMRAVFERISPLNHADKIRSALLVVHGKNDPRVPFFEAQQIAAKVRARGQSVWTVFADNEGHGFGKKDNNDYARAVEVMFLQKHLGL